MFSFFSIGHKICILLESKTNPKNLLDLLENKEIVSLLIVNPIDSRKFKTISIF